MRIASRKTTAALASALALSFTGGIVCGLPVPAAFADPAAGVTLADAKATGVKTDIGEYGSMYVVALSEAEHTHMLELRIFGELKMPYTAQDVDFADTDANWYKPNKYMKGSFEWAPTDSTVGKYDRTVFQNSLPVNIKKGTKSIRMALKGEEFDLKLPAGLTQLDLSPLQGALTEHRNQYEAAKSQGMKIVPETAQTFEAAMTKAQALLEKAEQNPTAVTQDELAAERIKLNEAFADLKPAPYEREALARSLAAADAAIARIPQLAKQKQGYERAGYNAFYRAYLSAKELMDSKDLTFILGPHEGGPLKTQRDFDNAARDLASATTQLSVIAMEPAKTESLRNAFFAALERMPSQGHGWEPASGTRFMKALQAAQLLLNTAYPEQAELDAALTELTAADKALTEVALDQATTYTMSIRFRHPDQGAPSALINAYFKDESGSQITVPITGVLPGSEQRIYLDNFTLIKQFKDYKPEVFFYGSDDTSLGKVRLFTDKDGRQFISFTAERNADLDVQYVLGKDDRHAPDAGGGHTEEPGAKNPGAKDEQEEHVDTQENQGQTPGQTPGQGDSKSPGQTQGQNQGQRGGQTQGQNQGQRGGQSQGQNQGQNHVTNSDQSHSNNKKASRNLPQTGDAAFAVAALTAGVSSAILLGAGAVLRRRR
ncbi:LPXTG cell wall anchor domain-containing protein [Collinsella sp. AGMB00827]|uniref:LPXTG cell wall anchor domain-containing protein n=1 Tax=Collinsella ureilytica TaxID=2869515 RepID=A0ABS7MLI1_9ACTN|nr:LPXTG cell wall anchor domain-containing protein [Collinsella urealyticum]MBY4798225.1 LPXTG cell wall anchor domain-containing protein [Collinsella urealyticum]